MVDHYSTKAFKEFCIRLNLVYLHFITRERIDRSQVTAADPAVSYGSDAVLGGIHSTLNWLNIEIHYYYTIGMPMSWTISRERNTLRSRGCGIGGRKEWLIHYHGCPVRVLCKSLAHTANIVVRFKSPKSRFIGSKRIISFIEAGAIAHNI